MTRRPNIVLINCDDLGYGDLGCYGSDAHDTPRIDHLAAEGTMLTSFYMAAPVCTPSRGAMLTGCYPPRIGFDDFDGQRVLFPGMRYGLNPSETTMASMLKAAGYRTHIVGKWHCGDQPDFLPTNHGFDTWFGLPYSNDMGNQAGTWGEEEIATLEAAGFQLPPLPYPPLPVMSDTEVVEAQPDQTMLTRRYVDHAIDQMRAAGDDPFFLYFAHMHVHLPLYVEDRFHDGSRNGPYGAAVHAIDWATGALLDELDHLGLADDTIVIFTSDNGALARPGEGSNLPLRGRKGSTRDGGMRVPCIVRWPGRVPSDRVSDELTSAIDLLPTLATWCRVSRPEVGPIDGHDLADVLAGSASSPRDVFAYYDPRYLEAVRDDRYKLRLIAGRDGDRRSVRELYDLASDIGETTDVAADHPDVVARLEAAATAIRDELGDAMDASTGTSRRRVGTVPVGHHLTSADGAHPIIIAEYDLADRG
ncbi:MAG: sulfatase [Actinomycetota bacterium]